VLSGCGIKGETWSLVFEKLATKQKWMVMKQLALEECLDDMEICGKCVTILDLVEYCSCRGGSRDAMLWGQKLTIVLLERGSAFPAATSVAFMKRALDLGIVTGNIVVQVFILYEMQLYRTT
jgi:hypothetical protein